mgnify:CR=1 FL=1
MSRLRSAPQLAWERVHKSAQLRSEQSLAPQVQITKLRHRVKIKARMKSQAQVLQPRLAESASTIKQIQLPKSLTKILELQDIGEKRFRMENSFMKLGTARKCQFARILQVAFGLKLKAVFFTLTSRLISSA